MYKKTLIAIITFLITFTVISCGNTVGSSIDKALEDNHPASFSSKTLSSIAIINPPSVGIIDESLKTASITVPYGTDVTNLVASFSTTGKTTTINGIEQVSGETANDFTNPVIYTITAEDGSNMDYTVTINVASSNAKTITVFSILGVSGTINESAKIIGLTLPCGTDVTSLAALFRTTGTSVKVGSTVQVSNETTNNFTNPVIFTVIAADGSTTDYTVTVSVAQSDAKAITAFSILGVSGIINESAKTIKLEVPNGTDLTSLVATFTVSTGASVNIDGTVQSSGVTANTFMNPVTYTVVAEDGSTIDYTVTVKDTATITIVIE